MTLVYCKNSHKEGITGFLTGMYEERTHSLALHVVLRATNVHFQVKRHMSPTFPQIENVVLQFLK